MNLTQLPSGLLPLAGGNAVQSPANVNVAAQLHAATGNQLLGLDVWAGTGAADRLLGTRGEFGAPSAMQLDQLVNHILAPLG